MADGKYGMVVDGRIEAIPGIPLTEQLNYKIHPELKLKAGEDMRARHTRWIRNIIAHTTKGKPTSVERGKGPDTRLEERIIKLWSTDNRHAGAHVSIDWDGTICCHCDLVQDAAYHAGVANEVSIGFELFQDSKGRLYSYQIEVALRFIEWCCKRFRIQRQMLPISYNKVHPRLQRGGQDCVGVFGHRHITTDRGPGDPGNHIFEALGREGFQVFNFSPFPGSGTPDDKEWWIPIQKKYGMFGDGVPGPLTCDALQQAGYENGIWRPAEDPDQE